ncbi:MAG: DUF748 domain-containing protein [Candidatus Omnitrophica bacterium]|nr:DUF748 domain-containing protein [Candidatus Omnitrophota bacterium]
MRKLERILAVSILTSAIIFSAVYIYLVFGGKQILIAKIEEITKKKTSIGYFSLSLPLNLEIRNLNIEGLAKIDSLSISPDIIGFLTGGIIFNNVNLIRPQITYNKIPSAVSGVTASTDTTVTTAVVTEGLVSMAPVVKKIKPLRLAFKRLRVKDGKLDFIDQTTSPESIKVTVKNLNCNITNLYFFPRAVTSNFELSGIIPWREGQDQGKVELEGWLNTRKKDIRATFKIQDIDAVYLYPYYSKWVDLDKTRIEKAKLNLLSEIHGLNNNVTAECRLELTDMVRRPLMPGEPEEKAAKITDKVLDIFKTMDQGKVVLNFTIKTRMDSPEFGFGNIKMAFEDKVIKGRAAGGFKTEDALMFPAKLLEGGVKGMTDLSRAVISGTFAIGNEIIKSAGAVAKKEPGKK